MPAYVFDKKTNELVKVAGNAANADLKDMNVYSTEEKIVGTWIDGKPIYRKVISSTLSDPLTGLVTVEHNIQNIDLPIRIVCGNASNPDIIDGGVVIPAQYDSTTFIQLGAFSSSYVQLYCGSQNWTNKRKVLLCLEYTKTTD